MRLAIIGGTGVKQEQLMPNAQMTNVETPYGVATVLKGQIATTDVIMLSRHGAGHKVPPHRINYRANIWALHELGCQAIIATAAVGSLRPELVPGTLVLIDSFLDFTHGRQSTFFNGEDGQVIHQDMTYPYCETVRSLLIQVASQQHVSLQEQGCYVSTNGPRYETAAEVRAFGMLGGDVVGMTGVPEIVLARELDLCYAAVALVTNLGAGLQQGKLAHQDVEAVMQQSSQQLTALLQASVPLVAGANCSSC